MIVPDADPWRLNRNTVNFLRLVGRTRPGKTPAQAQAEMNALAVKLRQQFPEANARKLGVKLTPMGDQITGGYRRALWVLLGAVGFVLLVACANLANLNLVRASGRQREMSIRSALGAGRWQIVKLGFSFHTTDLPYLAQFVLPASLSFWFTAEAVRSGDRAPGGARPLA